MNYIGNPKKPEAVELSFSGITPKGTKTKKIQSSDKEPKITVKLTQNDQRRVEAKKKKEELFKEIEDEKNSKQDFSNTFGYEKPIYGTTVYTAMVPKKFQYEHYYKGCEGCPEILEYTKKVPEKKERRIIISHKWIPADSKYWYREWKEDYDFIKQYGTKYNFNSIKPWNIKEIREYVENDLEQRRKLAREYDRKKRNEQIAEEIRTRKIEYELEELNKKKELEKFAHDEKMEMFDIKGMTNFLTSKKWNNLNKFGLNVVTLGFVLFATNASVEAPDHAYITSCLEENRGSKPL